jgi:O-6-methylguanine DNA methyltransferase
MTFRDKVYEVTRQIPRGKVATYGQIARLVGSPHAARAVGMCMRTNPFAPIVPCHRVVAANGALAGYSAAGGVEKKRALLQSEGVTFQRDRVNMKQSCWHPQITAFFE